MKFILFMLSATAILAGCSSAPKNSDPIDSAAAENAVFVCKQNIQKTKKARFQKLPRLLQRLSGDHQILKRFTRTPSTREISAAIGKFPLAGDSGGTWRLQKEAHLRTVTGRIETQPASSVDPHPVELFSLIVGQPGRVYSFPVTKLQPYKLGLKGQSLDDTLELRIVDEHHVLISASTWTKKAQPGQAQPAPATLFYPSSEYALVRTYLEQTFDDETKSQLSDYPIYGPAFSDETCE